MEVCEGRERRSPQKEKGNSASSPMDFRTWMAAAAQPSAAPPPIEPDLDNGARSSDVDLVTTTGRSPPEMAGTVPAASLDLTARSPPETAGTVPAASLNLTGRPPQITAGTIPAAAVDVTGRSRRLPAVPLPPAPPTPRPPEAPPTPDAQATQIRTNFRLAARVKLPERQPRHCDQLCCLRTRGGAGADAGRNVFDTLIVGNLLRAFCGLPLESTAIGAATSLKPAQHSEGLGLQGGSPSLAMHTDHERGISQTAATMWRPDTRTRAALAGGATLS